MANGKRILEGVNNKNIGLRNERVLLRALKEEY